MNRIYSLLILCFFISCNEKKEEKKEIESTQNDPLIGNNSFPQQISTTISIPDSIFFRVKNELKEESFPASYESIYAPDSNWIKLSNHEIESFIPQNALENLSCEVYGISKFDIDSLTAIIYYMKFPEIDFEDLDEIKTKTILTLYDSKNSISDYITLAKNDYGLGSSKMQSPQQIIYLYHTEMEFIQLIETKYLIVDNKFKETDSKYLEFGSSKAEYEKFNTYIENVLK